MSVDVNMIEAKKTQQLQKPATATTTTTETAVKAGQWKNYFGDIKDEFKKINWTSPEELKTYTKIVVAMTFFCGMGLYVMDIVIQTVLTGLNGLMRLIGG